LFAGPLTLSFIGQLFTLFLDDPCNSKANVRDEHSLNYSDSSTDFPKEHARTTWQQVSVSTDERSADLISGALLDLGALSASLEDEGNQPLFEPKPGETPIWHNTRVIALFESVVDLESLRNALIEAVGRDRFTGWEVEVIEDQAWERAWLEHFRPMCFGSKLWIVPTGFEEPSGEDAVCVHLDPGLAFGTGTHPTTALCLAWLDQHPPKNRTVIDFGCGSGILGIAAVLLGAQQALCVDIDPQALVATRDNADKNHVAAKIECFDTTTLPSAKVDVVLANILANPLIELAPRLADLVKTGGSIVLSGVLQEQAAAVKSAYQAYFEMDEPTYSEDWARLTGRRSR
jgi:ribosomal protein L11 methyltransferase